MPPRHRWEPVYTLLEQGRVAPCGHQATAACKRCPTLVCGMGDVCQHSARALKDVCEPPKRPPGRPLKPADPAKPGRKATQLVVGSAFNLLDSQHPCIFCHGDIFQVDGYCRHCGRRQTPLRSPLLGSGHRDPERVLGDLPVTKTIFIANAYGFSDLQRSTLLPPVIAALEVLGLTVQEPLAFDNRTDPLMPNWMYQFSQRAFADVAKAGAVFAMVDGTPPDEGVMVQLGMAIAMRKPTFLFRDDVRRATENGDYPLNLMLFTGMPPEGWRDHYYTTLDEITAPQKALARWARQ